MEISLTPIGFVSNNRVEIMDDNWGKIRSTITLTEDYPVDSLDGIGNFSHVIILFYFDKVEEDKILKGARHPRNIPSLPRVGIFAQRAKNRPNKIGLAVCKLIQRRENRLIVEGLDAIDGTPVLDIKPYIKELDKRNSTQPDWVKEIMKNYF